MGSTPSSTLRRGNWPDPAQFNEAVQNLATTMSDRELQGGEAELSASGMPMPYAGNFADVYKVHCPATGNTWAVKFFKREVRDLRERYRAISEHLIVAQLPFAVEFRYVEEGVRIGGTWYPLVKMRWIEGQSLNRFVAESLGQPKMLDQLLELWVKLAARLRKAGIAHADLQHGNVVLVPEADTGRLLLRLIDYDGMFVPSLAGEKSTELGHANYQHPLREKTQPFHAELDRFSHLAICCALRCLRVGGLKLWDQFNNSENLLFTPQDFANPGESKLFRELWTLRNPDAHAFVGHLALATQRPLEESPLVEELVTESGVRPLTAAEQAEVERCCRMSEAQAESVSTLKTPGADASGSPLPVAAATASPPVPQAIRVPPVQPAPAAAEEETVAVAAPPFSFWSQAIFPLLLIDRLLKSLAGEEHWLLHNFFRVATVGAAVGAVPAAYYANSWMNQPPAPVVAQAPLLPPVEPEPVPEETMPWEEAPSEENPPEKTEPPETVPMEVTPVLVDPPENPFRTIPTPIPAPEPGPAPEPATTARPFAELPLQASGLALLSLPSLPAAGQKPAITKLANLHIEKPEALQLALFGTTAAFTIVRTIELQPELESPGAGNARAWYVVSSAKGAAKGEKLAKLMLQNNGALAFAWNPSTSFNPGVLVYCLLEMRLPQEAVLCELAAPQQIASPQVRFHESSGVATLALADFDTSQLPRTDAIRVEVSIGGQRFEPSPFNIDPRRDNSAASELITARSPLLRVPDPLDSSADLLEIKAAMSIDAQNNKGARVVIVPSAITRKVNKVDGTETPETQAASVSRLTKLQNDFEADIKRETTKRVAKTPRTSGVERMYKQMEELQFQYDNQSAAIANEFNPAKAARMKRALEDINERIIKLQTAIDKKTLGDPEPVDLVGVAERNRDRCNRAIDALSSFQQELQLRIYYEVDTPTMRYQLDLVNLVPGGAAASGAAVPGVPVPR